MASNPIASAIPDPDTLVAAVYEHATSADSSLHGDVHWRSVAAIGHRLIGMAQPAERPDPAVVFAFALLHDSQRLNDGRDPEHGPRAAALVPDLAGELLQMQEPALRALHEAIHDHTGGRTHSDPAIGISWDADRLTLWRVGFLVDPTYLSTLPGLDEATQRWAEELRDPPSWPELYAAYTSL